MKDCELVRSTAPWRRWIRVSSAAAVLATAVGCGGGDGVLTADKRAQIDAIVEQQMQSEGLPGVVLGVWVGNEHYVSVRGLADISTGRARAAGDPARIASVSKSFIGTATMILIDRGLLSRSDTVDRWYPSFPNAVTITVGDLLRMRSGIADSADTAFLEAYWDNPLLNLDAEDMIARSAARGLEFNPPNTITRYTGLRNTSYPTDSAMPGPLRGYGRASDTAPLEDRTVVDPTPAGGAGALISDLEDLRIYAPPSTGTTATSACCIST
jgi:D-alanyl-D-alanine carboxypeptidase